MLGDTVEAQALLLDSIGWARYGFGAEAEVQARLTEITVLVAAEADGAEVQRMRGERRIG